MTNFLNAFTAGLTFSDVVDIAIISYIIYRILRSIKTSRAQQLFQGILVVVALYALAKIAKLFALTWLIEKIASIGVIALMIVFQPELRRGLEYLGRGGFSFKQIASTKGTGSTYAADAICKAIEYFASIKEGALIVIERKTSLSDIGEAGTVIDSRISEELIENIFYLGAPLHDGAAIIRGDRVYAAGCVLPLSENPNLSKDLGTRHRAGIGITEQSDALVFIVSEETGIISMVEDGKISRFLDVKTVEKVLLSHYMEANEKASDRKILSSILNKKKESGVNE